MAKRRDVLKLAGFPALFAFGASAEKLPNATMSASKAKLTREANGDVRIYFQGATDQVQSMTAGSVLMKPGMVHPPHQHPEEEFMVVTEGTGEISLDGKVDKVSSGAMMYCAAGRMHGIANTGNTQLTFYFYKWKV